MKRIRVSRMFICLIIFQLSYIEYGLFFLNRNEGKTNFEIVNFSSGNISVSQEPSENRINPILKDLSDNASLNEIINVLVESKLNALSTCIKEFERYGKIEKILNYTHFSGFSGIIENDKLKMLLENLPNSIRFIEQNAKTELTLKDSLEQLRIFPYIRNNYSLKGDKYTSVAILDAGMDDSHASLNDKVIYWQDFLSTSYITPTDYIEHGTAVGSIACGRPYNTTDSYGRTIISERYYYHWTTADVPTIPGNYAYPSNAINIKANGTLKIEGNWFAEAGSNINIHSFRIINSSGYIIKEILTENKDQLYTLNYEINETNYDIYSIEHVFNVTSALYTDYGINMTIFVPENNSDIENNYSGVAPYCNIVALRCVEDGLSTTDDVIAAMNWVLNNYDDIQYNITSVVMSFKTIPYSNTVRNLANAMVQAGLIVSCAAGNSYSGNNYAGTITPGCADKVISVGAINYNSTLTAYSSQGGPSRDGYTTKPDIVAPGGVKGDLTYKSRPIYCPDSNDGLYFGEFTPGIYENQDDVIANDTKGVMGTSFAAPFVAGIGQLIIEALGGIDDWNYTEEESLFVKNLLLLTATETYPNYRLMLLPGHPEYSPTLDRGGKDKHEGYGKINPDAAIDAIKNIMMVNSTINSTLYSISSNDETKPYIWARKVYLPRNYYNITLEVPDTADFDLYIYDYQGDQYGDPIIRKKGVNDTLGTDEILIDYAPPKDDYYFIVVKGVNGSGQFNLSLYKSPTYFDKIPPTCHMLLPYNNSFLNGTILLKGNASDIGSGVKNATIVVNTPGRKNPLEFYFLSPGENFNTSWTSKKYDNGLCSIYVIAYDEFNNSATSNITYITIFNDNIPPIIEWLSPPDYASIIGDVEIKAKLTDEHSEVANATIYIKTRSRTYYYFISDIDEIIQYTWGPLISDDGLCIIYIKAYDDKDNLAESDALLVNVINQDSIRNIIIIMLIVILAGIVIVNKNAKKLLANERFMHYFDDLLDFIKKPSRKGLKKLSLSRFSYKKGLVISQINKINQLIKNKQYKKAILFCDYILAKQLNKTRMKDYDQFARILSDIKIDLSNKLENKKE